MVGTCCPCKEMNELTPQSQSFKTTCFDLAACHAVHDAHVHVHDVITTTCSCEARLMKQSKIAEEGEPTEQVHRLQMPHLTMGGLLCKEIHTCELHIFYELGNAQTRVGTRKMAKRLSQLYRGPLFIIVEMQACIGLLWPCQQNGKVKIQVSRPSLSQ